MGDDFAPLPATWDVTHRQWRAYGVTGATSGLCDGCHSVNYDIERKTVTEWNVGCERCHGPGSDHVARPAATNIVNPARLSTVAAVDVCVQCHSEGHPHAPIGGREFHWPVGFRVGLRLADFWKLDEHTPGTQDTLHFPDGSARENRMQGNDFVQSLMYTRGVTCASCHDPHGTPNNADLIKPARTVCLTCHGPKSPNGPHTATIEQHTHHAPGSPGSECVSCHMPKIAVMLGDVMVRSHTFRVHRAGGGGAAEDARRLHDLSHGQDAGLGDRGVEDVAGVLAVASRPVSAALAAVAVLLSGRLAAGQVADGGCRSRDRDANERDDSR